VTPPAGRPAPVPTPFFLLGVGVSVLALLVPFAGRGAWGPAWAAFGLGLLWAFAHLRGSSSPRWAHGGLLGLLALAALGALFGPAEAALLATIAALAAWDLDRFARRLRDAERVEAVEALWRSHARRLAGVLGVGLLLGSIALEGRIALGLGSAILLGALGLWGIAHVLRRLGPSE